MGTCIVNGALAKFYKTKPLEEYDECLLDFVVEPVCLKMVWFKQKLFFFFERLLLLCCLLLHIYRLQSINPLKMEISCCCEMCVFIAEQPSLSWSWWNTQKIILAIFLFISKLPTLHNSPIDIECFTQSANVLTLIWLIMEMIPTILHNLHVNVGCRWNRLYMP